MPRTPAPHRLRVNHIERSPKRILVVDTETRWEQRGDRERHVLRLWCTRTVQRVATDVRPLATSDADGVTAVELADHVDATATGDCTTWLYAHNLGFDLIVTRLVLGLLARGWRVGRHALTIDTPWVQLSHGRRRLTMADSVSQLPASVERLGTLLGIPKVELPDNDDSDAAWLARCRGDVAITTAALLQLMAWWDEQRLGCWSLTGAATGWNAYRHRRELVPVDIDPDPAGRAFERRAINGGRREAWRVGELPRSRYVELDIERAHLTAARCFHLPVRRSNAFGPIELDDVRMRAHQYGVIAEVTVHTETPRYPLVWNGRTWHPVGTFRTILCGPELRDAQARGELVAIHRGITYRLGPSMARWGHWIAGLLDGDQPDAPPMALLAAKSWSRRVPGKWATRTAETIEHLSSIETGWRIERGVHHPSEIRCALLHMAGDCEVLVQDIEADDSFPAVLAWIQSLTRLALGRMVDHFGRDRLVSCNTDGLIVKAPRGVDLQHLAELLHPFVPRVKGVYRSVEVISPQHLILDGEPRLSGIPRSAGPIGGSSWSWQTWPRFTRQLERGDQEAYTRDTRSVELANVPVSRWVLTDGSTLAPRAILTASGAPQWVNPYEDATRPLSAPLRPSQCPQLASVLEPAPAAVA